LDEIGELPMILQVKLLRAIQEKTFRRVGGAEDIKVDVRVLAATNQDLAQAVKNGGFREDLYYRLNVVPIHIPPLRERKEDIVPLIDHFVQKFSAGLDKESKQISSYSKELLLEYEFPGNVRELENIIEKSVALGISNIVLPENLIMAGQKSERGNVLELELPEEGINLNDEISKIERELIKKALKKTQGSKSKAAKLLRISLDSLRYRIEKLGIQG
jgi:two-component system response regulator PilR (NtrC family)